MAMCLVINSICPMTLCFYLQGKQVKMCMCVIFLPGNPTGPHPISALASKHSHAPSSGRLPGLPGLPPAPLTIRPERAFPLVPKILPSSWCCVDCCVFAENSGYFL